MKILYILFLMMISSSFNAASGAAAIDDHLDDLCIIETFMGNRRTNVGCHPALYPYSNLPLAVNCHPYTPTIVAGSIIPACASHPLVARYNPDIVRDVLPEYVRTRLDAASPTCQLLLNIQDNPWNGTQIQLRAHAFSDLFPAMGGNYQGVNVLVCRGDGTPLLSGVSSVYLHDGVASPSNFAIAGLDHTLTEDFFSVVTYLGRTVITRHILLTVPARERFQDFLCAPTASDRSPSFFLPLLGADYSLFLSENGVI